MIKINLYLIQLISQSINLLATYLIARKIDAEVAGEYFFLIFNTTIVTGLISGPMGMWLTREPTEFNAIKAWDRILIFIYLISIPLLLINSNVGLCSLILALNLKLLYYAYKWNSCGDVKRFTIYTSGPQIIKFINTIILLYLFDTDSISAYLAANIIGLLLIMVMFNERNDKSIINIIRINEAKKSCASIFTCILSGLPIIGGMTTAAIIFALYQMSDKFIAKYYLGYAAVAALTLTMQFSYQIIITALQPYLSILYPKIIQLEPQKSVKFITLHAKIVLALTTLISLISYLFSRAFQEYIPSNFLIILENGYICFLAGGLLIMSQIINIFFARKGFEMHYIKALLPSTLATIPAMIILINIFNLKGVFLGHLFFSLTYLIISMYLFSKLKDVNND